MKRKLNRTCIAVILAFATHVSVCASASPYPLHVVNLTSGSAFVVSRMGEKTERFTVAAGEETIVLTPYDVEDPQSEKSITAIETESSRFDMAFLRQEKLGELVFVLRTSSRVEIFLAADVDSHDTSFREIDDQIVPIMTLEGREPNKTVDPTPGDAPRIPGSPSQN